MVELENHKAEYLGPDEEGNLMFKDNQTFDELKLKENDVDDKMRGWLKGSTVYLTTPPSPIFLILTPWVQLEESSTSSAQTRSICPS